jgi:hypothetical protein
MAVGQPRQLDFGGIPVLRSFLRALVASALLLAANGAVAQSVLAAACDGATDSLGNGGFETPVVAADTFTLFPEASVPPWHTTDVADEIEIWGDGFNGVPAGEGNAFAELNANSAGTLYQDVVTTPGSTMSWTLLHRARIGTDVMQVLIGDATVADVTGSTGWDFTSSDLSDDTSAWGTHTGDYVVPAGQTCTRFAFRAVSSGAGNDSFGNFLDAIGFSVSIPASPTPVPSAQPTATPRPVITEPPTDLVAATNEPQPVGPLPMALLMAGTGLGVALAAVRRRRVGRS